MRPKLPRLLVGLLATALLAGPAAVFVHETLPYRVPTSPAPDVRLAASVASAARAFPMYQDAIPVINFHDISTRRGLYSVTPSQFATDLQALQAAGFHTVTLQDVDDLLAGKHPALPPRPLLITFDDGIASEYVNADAILAKYGFTAVTFVISGSIAAKSPSYYVTKDELTSLDHNGRWTVGSHTDRGHRSIATGPGTTGPWLTNRYYRPDGTTESFASWETRVDADLARSVSRLDQLDGQRPTAFAYPFSAARLPANDPRIPDELGRIVARNFSMAFTADLNPTTAIGASSPRWELPRFEVVSSTTTVRLLDALAVMVPQAINPNPTSWQLTATGGSCAVQGRTVTLTAASYARCSTPLNTTAWTDYTVSTVAAGLGRGATAILAVRDGPTGRVEIAVSDAWCVVRQLLPDGRWRQLTRLPLHQARWHRISAAAHGGRIDIDVDGRAHYAALVGQRGAAAGGVGFGMATTGRHQIEFGDIVVSQRVPSTP